LGSGPLLVNLTEPIVMGEPSVSNCCRASWVATTPALGDRCLENYPYTELLFCPSVEGRFEHLHRRHGSQSIWTAPRTTTMPCFVRGRDD
jgi:hypothetical protein